MATVPVKKKRTIYSLSVTEQYPRAVKFMRTAPTGHRSAQICQIIEQYLEWQETGQVSMLAILARLREVVARIERGGIIDPDRARGHSIELGTLPNDVLDNLVSLGE